MLRGVEKGGGSHPFVPIVIKSGNEGQRVENSEGEGAFSFPVISKIRASVLQLALSYKARLGSKLPAPIGENWAWLG